LKKLSQKFTKNKMKRGKFIVFEGIDGCGKGTQLEMATSYFFKRNKKTDIYMTREPTRNSAEIRARMANGRDVIQDKEWYTKAFFRDRLEHCEKNIAPALAQGTDVFCDRYKHSTIGYQSLQGMNLQELIQMHKENSRIIVPDLTLIYDCPAEIAFERRKADNPTDVFDKDLKFQTQLRKIYIQMGNLLPDERIAIINATLSPEKVFIVTKTHIEATLLD